MEISLGLDLDDLSTSSARLIFWPFLGSGCTGKLTGSGSEASQASGEVEASASVVFFTQDTSAGFGRAEKLATQGISSDFKAIRPV